MEHGDGSHVPEIQPEYRLKCLNKDKGNDLHFPCFNYEQQSFIKLIKPVRILIQFDIPLSFVFRESLYNQKLRM